MIDGNVVTDNRHGAEFTAQQYQQVLRASTDKIFTRLVELLTEKLIKNAEEAH